MNFWLFSMKIEKVDNGFIITETDLNSARDGDRKIIFNKLSDVLEHIKDTFENVKGI